MHILNLMTKQISKELDNIDLKKGYHFIICNPWELKFFKEHLNINKDTYKDCLSFDDKVQVRILDEYIYFTLINFQVLPEDILLEEINIFLCEKYILVVLRKRNQVYNEIKKLLRETFYYKSNTTLSLFIIYSAILRIIISNQFENIDKVEERILKLEDEIVNEVKDDISIKISQIRNICRTCVKNIRPLTYIIDILQKEGMQFFSNEKLDNKFLEKEYVKLMEGLDSSIDKLYSFALSTRELADKLLDIYSSKVSERTNNLITKLTLLTGTAVPISIITGVYGMNFKYMPELNYLYGYKITMVIIISILVISFIIFKRKKML